MLQRKRRRSTPNWDGSSDDVHQWTSKSWGLLTWSVKKVEEKG